MKKLKFKIALWKRQFHLWQRVRIERKLSILRKKMLDLLAEEGET